jgi:AcrR family transcriptional regulator
MSIEKRTRPYRKRRRAQLEAQTRLRITEAAVRLHGTIGPARTTIKDIAAEAGVQRATVYRHFPDLESLFMACSAHWASTDPPPEPADWERIADPDARLRYALTQLYGWYEWAEPMLVNVRRDGPLVPASRLPRERMERRFEALHAALMHGRRGRGRARQRVATAIAHALEFETWRSLKELGSDEVVELMCALVEAAALRRPAARSAP